MLLFWKKTTAKGIVASIIVGIVAAVGIILLSPDMLSSTALSKLRRRYRSATPASFRYRSVSLPL